MAGMEERYKKYIEKAKSVIKTLDPKHNPAAAPEINILRAQLSEKDKVIDELERESEKSKVRTVTLLKCSVRKNIILITFKVLLRYLMVEYC